MSDQHFADQKALATTLLQVISTFFGPRFCAGCAMAALLTAINRIVEVAIRLGDEEMLRNTAEGLSRIAEACRNKRPISDQSMVVLGLPPVQH